MGSLSAYLEDLRSFDIAAYRDRAFRIGRREIRKDADFSNRVHVLCESSNAVSAAWSGSGDRRLRNVLDIACLFFDAQDYILRNERPRYEPYAGVRLLRHILGVERGQRLAATERRIWQVFRVILQAQIDFEVESLSGTAEPRRQFEPEVSRSRFAGLVEVKDLVPRQFRLGVAPDARLDEGATIEELAEDPSAVGVARYLLAFPQTPCHDEVAFQRLIQMSECLFWGALVFVQRALAAIRFGDGAEAAALIRTAATFGAPLAKILAVVRIMPPEHFLAFRDATGDASAVQSLGWQLLDAHMYGVLPEKVETLARVPEVSQVLRLANGTFVPLVRAVESFAMSARTELHDAVVSLDHKLRAWRTYHKNQLAGRRDPAYLPTAVLGTGGTSGYGYLAAHQPPRPRAPSVRLPAALYEAV